MSRDPYEILGVDRDADVQVIRKAYRKLAAKYHPDQNPGDSQAEERFKEVAAAWEILGDEERRARYDRFGRDMGAGEGFPGGFQSDFSADMFSDLFDFFGGNRGGRSTKPKLLLPLVVPFVEAARGGERQFKYRRKAPCRGCKGQGTHNGMPPSPCRRCGGMGQIPTQRGFLTFASQCDDCQGSGVDTSNPCASCRGSGVSEQEHQVSFRVPPGVTTGTRLRIRDGGHYQRGSSSPGDLYIEVQVEEHPFFKAQGKNIYCEAPIGFSQAALGGKVEIPTVDGKTVEMKIPVGTQNGTEFRLRGKGIGADGQRGHQFVRVVVVVPKNLDAKSKTALRAYAEAVGDELNEKDKSLWEMLGSLFD
ncbi:MAG: molecular chaperone DnaJ [Myxococcales bacterium]|nr:molecular chaperone DnaJ [Myxococcales bacterium]